MDDRFASRPARPVRDACGQCAVFAVLLAAGVAAWTATFMVLVRL